MRPTESFVNQPVRSLQTMLRVLSAGDSRYRQVIPDGIYGPQTMTAVSTFQRIHGLPVTGVADQPTWDALVAVYTPIYTAVAEAQPLNIVLNPNQVIRRGETNANIYLVQAILTVFSDLYSSISRPGQTGVLDTATSDSLSAFQQLSRLPMTGELDKVTWKQLALQYPIAANRTNNS